MQWSQLGIRATEGLVSSIIGLLKIDVSNPDYTTLSRRQKNLDVEIRCSKVKEGLHILIDYSGLKVYGEGEWKVRQHGYNRRSTWRKIHLGVDESTGDIVAAVLITSNVNLEVYPILTCQLR